jgi:chromosome segregation ATPase
MQDRDREIQAREQRIAALEATAAERLTAMQDRDLLISNLQTEIESRDRAIQEIGRRAGALEAAAGERLAAVVARDQVIATLQTQFAALHEKLDGALAAIAEEQACATALEHDIEQIRALQSRLESERAGLILEKDVLLQQINRLEKEGLRDYLARRYNRDRPKPGRG